MIERGEAGWTKRLGRVAEVAGELRASLHRTTARATRRRLATKMGFVDKYHCCIGDEVRAAIRTSALCLEPVVAAYTPSSVSFQSWLHLRRDAELFR